MTGFRGRLDQILTYFEPHHACPRPLHCDTHGESAAQLKTHCPSTTPLDIVVSMMFRVHNSGCSCLFLKLTYPRLVQPDIDAQQSRQQDMRPRRLLYIDQRQLTARRWNCQHRFGLLYTQPGHLAGRSRASYRQTKMKRKIKENKRVKSVEAQPIVELCAE